MDVRDYVQLGANVFASEKTIRLEPSNKNNSLDEGLQAKIKDPLWLLGRQWQTGEFQAQNGGQPVRTEVEYCSEAINQIKKGLKYESFDIDTPIEMLAEQEGHGIKKIEASGNLARSTNLPSHEDHDAFVADNWDSQHLEYNFEVKGEQTVLEARDYTGNNLDWYNFNIREFSPLNKNRKTLAVFPKKMNFYGMPSARWWEFEDREVDIGSFLTDNMNYLLMALSEFCLIHSNDWFTIPIKMEAGYLRQVKKFKVFDTFGVASYCSPAINLKERDWAAFTPTPMSKNTINDAEGSLFFMPNNLPRQALESEPIEEISFIRDELANLVWGVERRYQKLYDSTKKDPNDMSILDILQENEVVNRQSEEKRAPDYPVHYWDTQLKKLVKSDMIDETSDRFVGPIEKFSLMSYVPDYWIPYQAQKIKPNDPTNEQIALRRSRTKIDTSDGQQYKGKILEESKIIAEEQIPRGGIIVQRVWQLARDEKKNFYVWRSRKKRPDIMRRSSQLRFDYIERKGGVD